MTRRVKHKLLKLAIVLAAIAGLCAWYYFGRIAPVMLTVVKETVRMQVSKAIDDMTDSELQGMEYGDLVIVRYDEKGYVSLLQINSVAVDLFARKVTSLIRDEMKKFEEQGISIHLGTMSGMPFLSGTGPDINIHAISLGVVDADFSSEFEDAGLNQTIHRLYMTVVVNMNIILPGYTLGFDNSSKVMISESVIAGEVPFGDMDIGVTEGTGDLVP